MTYVHIYVTDLMQCEKKGYKVIYVTKPAKIDHLSTKNH